MLKKCTDKLRQWRTYDDCTESTFSSRLKEIHRALSPLAGLSSPSPAKDATASSLSSKQQTQPELQRSESSLDRTVMSVLSSCPSCSSCSSCLRCSSCCCWPFQPASSLAGSSLLARRRPVVSHVSEAASSLSIHCAHEPTTIFTMGYHGTVNPLAHGVAHAAAHGANMWQWTQGHGKLCRACFVKSLLSITWAAAQIKDHQRSSRILIKSSIKVSLSVQIKHNNATQLYIRFLDSPCLFLLVPRLNQSLSSPHSAVEDPSGSAVVVWPRFHRTWNLNLVNMKCIPFESTFKRCLSMPRRANPYKC